MVNNAQSKNNDELNNKAPQRKNKTKKKGIENLPFWDKTLIVIALSIIFICLFLIMYRNSKINEAFSELNTLKNEISRIEKENVQLEVKIQSSLNLSNVEQSAKELLGMQKLTNSQTIYISLPKKDYIETSVEDVSIENDSFFEKVKKKIKNIF